MKLTNKYFWIKMTVVGLTALTITATAYSYVDPRFSQVPRYTETSRELLKETGNALWNYEVKQQKFTNLNYHYDQDFIIVN